MNDTDDPPWMEYDTEVNSLTHEEYLRYRKRNRMAFEHKENSGSIFKNDYKETDKQPDMRGDAKINGRIIRIAGWKSKTNDGKAYLSLRFSDPQEFKAEPDTTGLNDEPKTIKEDDLPF